MSVYNFSNKNSYVKNVTDTLPEDMVPGDIINVYGTMQDEQGNWGITLWKTTQFSLQQGVYFLQLTGGVYGGYSEGILTLNEKTVIYADIGQRGMYGVRGFPDGGTGYKDIGQCGTGSTCVKLRHDSPYARVIVAGGAGGGLFGNAGDYKLCRGGGLVSGHHEALPETGQTSGYSFGSYAQDANASQMHGGGGGWYTGYAGGGNSYPASGGSGYVYTEKTKKDYPSGCLLTDNDFLACAYTTMNTVSYSEEGTIKITFLRDTVNFRKKNVYRVNSNIYKNTDEASVADISKLSGGGSSEIDNYTEQEMHSMIDTIWDSYSKEG